MRRIISFSLVLVLLIGTAVTVCATEEPGPGADLYPPAYTFDSEYELSYEDIPVYGTGYYNGSEQFDMSKNTGDSRPTSTYANASFVGAAYSLVSTFPQWYSYDFLDLQLLLDTGSVTSISAYIGDLNIPIEYGYVGSQTFTGDTFNLTVRLDIRGISFTNDAHPVLQVQGVMHTEERSSYTLVAASGVKIVNDPNLSWMESILDALHDFHQNVVAWFDLLLRSIGTWFNELEASFDASIQKVVDAINGDSSAGDQMGADVAEKTEQLEQIGAAFDSVERPAVDDINMSVDAYVSPEDLTLLTAGLTAAIVDSPMMSVLMMAFILATVGYILYGKK